MGYLGFSGVIVLFLSTQLGLAWARSASTPSTAIDYDKRQTYDCPEGPKPRIFIMTDITSDPDDEMSMVRYLLYSNHFDSRGFVATTSTVMNNETHPERITEIIQTYGEVVHNLNKQVHPECSFPPADSLLPLVSSGPKVTGKAALDQPVSHGALDLIARLKESAEPLYVLIWGGPNTLAQALQHMELTETAAEAALLRLRLRVYQVSDQDDTGSWTRMKWQDIYMIVNVHSYLEYPLGTWGGIHAADNGFSNRTKVLEPWLDQHIRIGTLGAEYARIRYSMEGDTPTFLWLIPNGLTVPEHIEWGSWGGRYARIAPDLSWYGTSQDSVVTEKGQEIQSIYSTVWRWRDAFQDDFASRMQWSLGSNTSMIMHPPIPAINGSKGVDYIRYEMPFNSTIVLDARDTFDPDHPEGNSELDFEWFLYGESGFPRAPAVVKQFIQMRALAPAPDTNGTLLFNDSGFSNVITGPLLEITNNIPPGLLGDLDWHFVLQVRTKRGMFSLRRYKRVIIKTLYT